MLTHFNEQGEAHMVDVREKPDTKRMARACGTIRMNDAAWKALQEGTAKKGDVLGTARLAGIMAAKRTFELIPLCHMLGLTHCEIGFTLLADNCLRAECRTECVGKTGVEMEALTGVNIALLTVYDMLKAVDRGMVISDVYLVEKDGGRSGHVYGGNSDNQ